MFTEKGLRLDSLSHSHIHSLFLSPILPWLVPFCVAQVRNSSTLLFSTLITRIFGVKKGKDEHSKKNRSTASPSLKPLHHYNGILPMNTNYIIASGYQTCICNEGQIGKMNSATKVLSNTKLWCGPYITQHMKYLEVIPLLYSVV